MISVYHFGTFDVSNYGDLLFPLLARKRLEKMSPIFTAVSPTNKRPIFSDCIPAKAIDEVEFRTPGLALIGGGNIVYLAPTGLPDYNSSSTIICSYPDLWIGASCLADYQIPVCWNAPGVPKAFADEKFPLIRECLKRCAYISVRGEQSREFLKKAYPEAQIESIPDPAWDICNLWRADQIDSAYRNVFLKQNVKQPPSTIAVHLNSRYLARLSLKNVAEILDKISVSMNATIILVGIGPCHGDDDTARKTGSLMHTMPVILDRPESLLEIASCIARSIMYAGSSMHGFITASTFGIPACCVANGVKFEELKLQLNDESIVADSWETIEKQLFEINSEDKKKKFQNIFSSMRLLLDAHWNRIVDVTRQKQNGQMADHKIKLNETKSFLQYRANLLIRDAETYLRSNFEATKTIAEMSGVISNNELEIARYKKELSEMYNSRSWKITKPLRIWGHLVRRMFTMSVKPANRCNSGTCSCESIYSSNNEN